MDKLIRGTVFIAAGVCYFFIIKQADGLGNTIGIILLGALLLMSMESVRRKRDYIFGLRSEVKELNNMSKELFIQYIAELFKRLGYYVRPIPKYDNKGTDIIVKKGRQIICIKCGIAEEDSLTLLRELYGSMNYYKANKSILISNQYIQEDARSFAKDNQVKLIDKDQLLNMIGQVTKNDKLATKDWKAQEV